MEGYTDLKIERKGAKISSFKFSYYLKAFYQCLRQDAMLLYKFMLLKYEPIAFNYNHTQQTQQPTTNC